MNTENGWHRYIAIQKKMYVESCLIFSSTSPAADGLKCYCALVIDGVELPPVYGCDNNTCETPGVCSVDLQFKDDKHNVVKSNCLTNLHDVHTTLDIACLIEQPLHVVKCCNETDYCNLNLSVSLNNMPTPVPTVKPGSEGKNGGTKRYNLVHVPTCICNIYS